MIRDGVPQMGTRTPILAAAQIPWHKFSCFLCVFGEETRSLASHGLIFSITCSSLSQTWYDEIDFLEMFFSLSHLFFKDCTFKTQSSETCRDVLQQANLHHDRRALTYLDHTGNFVKHMSKHVKTDVF